MLNIRTFEGSKKKQSHEIYPEKKKQNEKAKCFHTLGRFGAATQCCWKLKSNVVLFYGLATLSCSMRLNNTLLNERRFEITQTPDHPIVQRQYIHKWNVLFCLWTLLLDHRLFFWVSQRGAPALDTGVKTKGNSTMPKSRRRSSWWLHDKR